MDIELMNLPTPPNVLIYDFKRFLEKIKINSEGCWIWTGALKHPPGYPYGFFQYKGKLTLSHRISYMWFVGELDSFKEIHHTCRNYSCVNPEHLQQLCREEHGKLNLNSRKTHCPKNHPYSGSNLHINPQGKRVCKICARENLRKRRARSY